MVERLRRAVTKHGLPAALRRAARVARARVWLAEEHVWYRLELTGDRPRRDLASELELVESTPEQASCIDRLPSMAADEARRLQERGARLFLVLEGSQPQFACWIHGGETPVAAARGGWLRLPAGIACLEDSVTSPSARGRGIAPAAWTAIGDRLGDEGVVTLVTKVEVENAPSRKAVEKAGFREFGVMSRRRAGPRHRAGVRGDGALVREIAAQLR